MAPSINFYIAPKRQASPLVTAEAGDVASGFVVRDLPWTAEKLRVIPPFEFENWAVIAPGGKLIQFTVAAGVSRLKLLPAGIMSGLTSAAT